MDQQELRAKVDEVMGMIVQQMPVPKDKSEELLVAAMVLGATFVGELLIDIKRIADACEPLSTGPGLSPFDPLNR